MLMLQLNRAVYAAGEPRAAVDVTPLAPGGITTWSCASPPGVKQGFGNEGVLIFGCHCQDDDGKVGDLQAELAIVWRLPFTMSLPAENRIGALLGKPNTFSSTSLACMFRPQSAVLDMKAAKCCVGCSDDTGRANLSV